MKQDVLKGIELGTVYRSASPVLSCAFAAKPTSRGEYVDRVSSAYALVYVLAGTGVFTDWNGVSYDVDVGCAIQMPAGRRHSVVQTPDGKWLEAWLTLDGRFGKTLIDLGTINESQPLLRPGLDRAIIERFERLRTDLHDTPDRDLPRTLASAHELLATIHLADRRRATVDPQTEMIEHACSELGRNLHEKLDIKTMAAGLDVSYERFRKIFRQRTGQSPGEYRIRRRIEQAQVMITQQRLSNKEIAYALGYADPFTFSKQFKQVVGVSPAAFRART
ncbi:AraC family transcriptional regulator [soil metagenome]